jgi:hypothetical protein
MNEATVGDEPMMILTSLRPPRARYNILLTEEPIFGSKNLRETERAPRKKHSGVPTDRRGNFVVL